MLELTDRFRPRTERAFVERVVSAVREYVDRPQDCDDGNEFVNPGRDELCGDNIDNDCNDGQRCNNGRCEDIPDECRVDNDCPIAAA